MTEREQDTRQQIEQVQPAKTGSGFSVLRQKMLEQQEVNQMMQAIGKEISLDAERRPSNLRLLRAFRKETQKSFVSTLSTQGILFMSQSHYGKIESDQEKAKLSDQEARKIEAINNLPMGWLDRDNSCAMFLPHEEFALVQLIRKAPQEAQVAIATLCKHIANNS